jgi:hypothetical protein
MLPFLIISMALSAGQVGPPGSTPAPALFPSPPTPAPALATSGPPAAEAPTGAEAVTIVAPLLPAPPAPAPPPAAPAPAATPPDRWFLMREAQGTWLGDLLDGNRLYLTGWFDMSFTPSTDGVSNQPVVWNDRANRFLFQQGWVRLGRSVVTSGTTEPTVGFQIDVLTGSDYRFTLPRGLFNSQLLNSTGAQNLYGVDPIQHYASLYVPTLFRGTEFRLGRVYCPWGVESNEAVSTPLVSRSYAFNWCPPFTHCGLGMYTTFSPEWSGMFMLANGNDVYFGDPSEELRFVGNIKWTQPGGGRNTVTLATSVGRGAFNSGAPFAAATVALANEPLGRNNLNAFDVVYTHTFSPVLSYNFEGIFGYQTKVPDIANAAHGGTAHWFSAAHYLFYAVSPRLTAILRYENFDDFEGQRTGFEGLYTAATVGAQYRIRKGLIFRPELRYDYNHESAPFEGKHQIFTAAADLIFRW